MAFDIEKLVERLTHPKSIENDLHAAVDKLLSEAGKALADLVPLQEEMERAADHLVAAAEFAHAGIDHDLEIAVPQVEEQVEETVEVAEGKTVNDAAPPEVVVTEGETPAPSA